tara:strand:+ start:933 stop:1748 length:816 start_codon:yes stop_codon:yes gene_type:complete
MPQKILLASGDSFTDPKFFSGDKSIDSKLRGGWPMWPELLGKELNLKVINTADSGRGNDYIAKQILDKIYEYGDQIDTCVVVWSNADRHDFHDKKKNLINIPHDLLSVWGKKKPIHRIELNILVRSYVELFSEEGENKFWENLLNESFRYMWLVAEACAKYNIKFIFRQGVVLLDYNLWNEIYEEGLICDDYQLKEVDYYALCDTNKYALMLDKHYRKNIVYPFWEYDNSIVSITDMHSDKLTISKTDRHPNAQGQVMMSKFLHAALSNVS